MYWHESEERKPNAHPMCTEFPAQVVSPSVEQLATDYLYARKLVPELAEENGWYVSTDAQDTYPRIVIPAVTHKAGHVYWQARDISGKAYIRYQSPKGPRHEALVKVSPFHAPRGIVVVEGPMDALAAAGEGYLSYALMGMQPNQSTLLHLALLIEDTKELNTLVVLDRDSAEHALRIALFLSTQGYYAKVKHLPGPEKDLAACLPKKRNQFLKSNFQNLFRSRNFQQQGSTEKLV